MRDVLTTTNSDVQDSIADMTLIFSLHDEHSMNQYRANISVHPHI
jgi:hypothetical protein